jgi:hypothetical protein
MISGKAPQPTSTPSCPAAEASDQLTALLEKMASALTTLDAAALLAIEPELDRAIVRLGALTEVGDRAQVLAATQRAGAALLRCRRLGASFSNVARALGRIGQVANGYDRTGTYVDGVPGRASLQIRA